MHKGYWYAIGAYGIWGLIPIYWKWLHGIPVLQVLSHRIVWSFLLLLAFILFARPWRRGGATVLKLQVLRAYTVAAVLIGINWLTYIWAINAGLVIETSLGYFINPLISVVLGVLVLGERLRRNQWVAVGLATAGVLYLTLLYGSLPWIALTLALTFAIYGLVKKIAPLGALAGLTLETGLLFAPALLYLFYSEFNGQGVFGHTTWLADSLLVGAGLLTTIPLLLFGAAAQRIPLSVVGLFQYIAPTIQFFLGVLVYKEPFTPSQFIGFTLVWLALLIFGIEGLVAYRAQTTTRADQS